jgi:hypothetical protein
MFRKTWVVVLTILLFSSISFADGGPVTRVITASITADSIAGNSYTPVGTLLVSSTDTVYSKAINISNSNTVAPVIMYRAYTQRSTTTGGAAALINVRLNAEMSYDAPSTRTEYSADTAYITPKNGMLDQAITDSNWRMATLDSVYMPYIRFRAVGYGNNSTSTRFIIKLGTQ